MRRKLQNFFKENLTPRQRQYEALRMLAFGDKSYEEIAAYFGYTAQSLRNFESLALRGKIDFFPAIKKGPKKPLKNSSTSRDTWSLTERSLLLK